MNAKKMTIEFSSALSNMTEVNPSFDTARLRIAYTGKNRNNSFISKEAFERAIPSMYNCPIVANYMRAEDEIGSHDGEFIKDKDGNVQYVNITQPVGVVPESASYDWETVEDDGVIHQYLCTDVLLWKRQEAYQKIKENGVTDQSMEISVTNGEIVDGYYNIKDFHFTAFCLLGNAEPCFESAALFTFSTDDFKQQYTEMMKEFKAAFSTANITTKEGERELDTLKELLEKYQLEESELDFEFDGLSDEELEAKIAEFAENKKSADDAESEEEAEVAVDESEEVVEESEVEEIVETEEVAVEVEEDSDDADSEDDDESGSEDGDSGEDSGSEDFALNSQIRDSLYEAVAAEKIETEWGSYSRRWMVDFDAEAGEVYFYDNEDGKLYGCSYRFDGDDAVVDFESARRKKHAFVDYVEGEEQQAFAIKDLVEMFDVVFAENKADKVELDRLTAFEKEILAERRKIEESSLFEKFENKLKDSKEFEALKSNAGEYTLEELEKELFVLVGKKEFSVEEPEVKNKPMNMPKEETNDGFGNLFSWKKETNE